MKTKTLLFAILVLLQATRLSAQVLPDSLVKKIDAVFTRGDNINSPGYAVGIVRNDSLIFAKGYGMANLEYAIPKYTSIYFSNGINIQTIHCLCHSFACKGG